MPRVTKAHCVSQDPSTGTQGMVFILPRGKDMLLLGAWSRWTNGTSTSASRTTARSGRCSPLRGAHARPAQAEIDVHEPVRAGLRPYRRQNVRVESEPGTRIIHNYGHGGSGVTLSWGCAAEVVQMAGQILAEPMSRSARRAA